MESDALSAKPKALVTGASSGIGRAVSHRLVKEGYSVLGLGRDRGRMAGIAGLEPVEVDLGALEELPVQLDALARDHAGVEVIVCSAGRGDFGSLEELSYERIRSLVDLNFLSQAYLARAFLPAMKRMGRGHLIFIGSEAALAGHRQGSIYCASKFALRGFAQALRQEVAKSGLRITLVNPGMVQTPFFADLDFAPGESPDNFVLADDVADAVWLALRSRPGTVLDEINLSPLKRVVRKT